MRSHYIYIYIYIYIYNIYIYIYIYIYMHVYVCVFICVGHLATPPLQANEGGIGTDTLHQAPCWPFMLRASRPARSGHFLIPAISFWSCFYLRYPYWFGRDWRKYCIYIIHCRTRTHLSSTTHCVSHWRHTLLFHKTHYQPLERSAILLKLQQSSHLFFP